MTGTKDGDMQLGGISKTGKPIDIDWIQISRFEDDGKIHETRAQMDLPAMMVPTWRDAGSGLLLPPALG